MTDPVLEEILGKGEMERELNTREIEHLLSVKDAESFDRILSTARIVKERHFGKDVFMYGFVYFSTFCRNNCTFCYYRRDNDKPRYRKSLEEVVALAGDLEDAGVNLVDLTMGEDPYYCSDGHRRLMELVSAVDSAIDVPLMASPGAMAEEQFAELRDAGADWFACYQETHNRDLFGLLRIEQDYDLRSNQKDWAVSAGLLAEEGIMAGVGESFEDRAASIKKMTDPRIDQVRVMTFVPQDGAPLAGIADASTRDELLTIAVLRITNPGKLIPASMDIEGLDGLLPRIEAGANVVTSIVPPRYSLAGVAQHDLDIENGNRSVERISEVLGDAGYRCGDRSRYGALIREWKHRTGAGA